LAAGRRRELLLVVALAVAGIWIYGKSAGLSFFSDDWDFILQRQGLSTGSLVAPHNGHLSLAPILIYKVLFATVGIDDYGPYRAVLVLLHCLSVTLLYLLLRSRLDRSVAVIGALLLLFLGSSGETLLYPFTMNFVGAVAFGLAAFLALERRDRMGDVLACLALLVSLSFSGLGVPFAVGALIELLCDPARRRASWIAGVPLVLMLGWALHYGGSGATLDNLDAAWQYIAAQNARSAAGLLGLPLDTWGPPVMLAIAVLVGRFLVRREVLSPRLLALLGAWGVFWVLTALSRAQLGLGGTERYVYPGATFLLLILAEVTAGWRPSVRARVLLPVVCVGAITANVGTLDSTAKKWSLNSQFVRADLAAMELSPNRIPADYQPPLQAWGLRAGQYFAVRAKWGSPALRPVELDRLPNLVSRSVDSVAQVGLGLRVVHNPRSGVERPTVESSSGGRISREGHCVGLRPGRRTAGIDVRVPAPGLAITNASGGPARVLVRRFAPDYTNAAIGVVAARTTAEFAPEKDPSSTPWRAHLEAHGRVRLCSVGA
jgi:hypothetical protein